MGIIPEVKLRSGDRNMPLIGMGTATFPFQASEAMKTAILHAIQLGYRHFDTAAPYQSEEPLGEAVAEAICLGYIKSRAELFITSKLWCTNAHHDLVVPALKNTLKNLQMDYLDLYLIHFPVSLKPGKPEVPFKAEDLLQMDLKSVWEAMEECQRLGLTKSIGVSNFSCKKLAEILSKATIPPAVNQVEMSPLWQQKKLREFCAEKGIHVSAWSVLGGQGIWENPLLLECEVLKETAKARGKTVAQVIVGRRVCSVDVFEDTYENGVYIKTIGCVCLRWVYEQGVSMIIKSFNKERLKENLHFLDWELTEEESHRITQIPQARGFLGMIFVSPDGPFKSADELWDGEV